MKIKAIKLSQARVNRENPRQISKVKFQKLIDSILVFPKMLKKRPPVVDGLMTVLGGNMRLMALRKVALSEREIISRLGNKSENP